MRKTTACPACDSASIRTNNVGDGNSRPGDARDDPAKWRCQDCGHYFDDPTERERKHDYETRGGLAGELARADPDDVGAE